MTRTAAVSCNVQAPYRITREAFEQRGALLRHLDFSSTCFPGPAGGPQIMPLMCCERGTNSRCR